MESNNSKHTQGEWKFNSYGDGVQIYSDKFGGIASIAHMGKHKEEHEANARLIASAPELLEALIALLDFVENPPNESLVWPKVLAKAAINKASQ